MDSSNRNKKDDEEAACELRSRRLRYLLGDGAAALEEPEPPVPVASSTLLLATSVASFSPPAAGNAVASTAEPVGHLSFIPASSNSAAPVPIVPAPAPAPITPCPDIGTTAAVLFLTGSGAQDLLRSLQQQLSLAATHQLPLSVGNFQESSFAATAAAQGPKSSRPASQVSATSSTATPAAHGPKSSRPASQVSATSSNATPAVAGAQSRRPSPGPIIVSDSSDIYDDFLEPTPPAPLKRSQPHNWRDLPSTSSAGLGDDNRAGSSAGTNKRKRPGRPKGSRNKSRKMDQDDSQSDSSDMYGFLEPTPAPLKRCRPLHNWRELPSTSSAGLGDDDRAAPTKTRRPGRPKGSKNKNKSRKNEDKDACESGIICHICRDGRNENPFTLTDCGHVFHKICLDRWISTSSQKYRTYKTCPYCGGSFEKTIPYFG